MRKISIGIFAVTMAILFILSTSISVTAFIHSQTVMILTSNVNDSTPYADVDMAPQNVWSYSNWNWTVDVSNGDDIIINTDYFYNNNLGGSGSNTGKHFFSVQATYENDPEPRRYDSAFTEIDTNNGQYGSGNLEIRFDDIDAGAFITLYWIVIATNKDQTPEVEDSEAHFGYITLT